MPHFLPFCLQVRASRTILLTTIFSKVIFLTHWLIHCSRLLFQSYLHISALEQSQKPPWAQQHPSRPTHVGCTIRKRSASIDKEPNSSKTASGRDSARVSNTIKSPGLPGVRGTPETENRARRQTTPKANKKALPVLELGVIGANMQGVDHGTKRTADGRKAMQFIQAWTGQPSAAGKGQRPFIIPHKQDLNQVRPPFQYRGPRLTGVRHQEKRAVRTPAMETPNITIQGIIQNVLQAMASSRVQKKTKVRCSKSHGGSTLWHSGRGMTRDTPTPYTPKPHTPCGAVGGGGFPWPNLLGRTVLFLPATATAVPSLHHSICDVCDCESCSITAFGNIS